MSQKAQSSHTSLEELRGIAFAVCLRKHRDGRVSAVFPQFSFGIGAGMTEAEALQDAEEILALGLESLMEHGEDIPAPLEAGPAKVLMSEWNLPGVDVEESWTVVEVKPECLMAEVPS
ncbi:hypothetical protein HYH02_004113 [Chlamydomonas schloesseri]|uniref:HicB-like antitoxin of toxin-antitoxin system domain-containing protein n=1 Tax=Chlamydomonas schloesseri TaxID=2026947 RepID=A0A835WRX7_9CHLO|nr:hypothetical protein HYH02_004113 [Chlamydomonas schloesseri]|eukprot:KAG2451515.1 hypothetical protein HYH02_004113 [Chlamydomonas schloesseri]